MTSNPIAEDEAAEALREAYEFAVVCAHVAEERHLSYLADDENGRSRRANYEARAAERDAAHDAYLAAVSAAKVAALVQRALALADSWRDVSDETLGRLTAGGSAQLDFMHDEREAIEAELKAAAGRSA